MISKVLSSGQGRRLLCLVLIVFFLPWAIAASYAAPSRNELVLLNDKGDVLFSAPIAGDLPFAIRYIHSVAKTPVTDFFFIKNGEIYLESTVYSDFGAGLPTSPEEGQTMKTEGGEIIISGIDRRLGDFVLRVGRVAHHTLLLFEPVNSDEFQIMAEVPLDKLAPPGSPVTFAAKAVKSRK